MKVPRRRPQSALLIGPFTHRQGATQLGRTALGVVNSPSAPAETGKGFTLPRKWWVQALRPERRVRPGTSCEPLMTTVGQPGHQPADDRREMKEAGPALAFLR